MKYLCAALLMFFLLPDIFPQEGEISRGGIFPPDSVRRPQREEAPRYPQDMVIGELGRGTAPQAAWLFARDCLNALIRQNRAAPALSGVDGSLYSRITAEIESLRPDRFRIGGGRVEADGTISFLVRFLSQEKSMAGELYVYQQEEPVFAGEEDETGTRPWRIDDLLLEESQNLVDLREAYRNDFTAYERLY